MTQHDCELWNIHHRGQRSTTANRRLAKKRVQCIYEALCFVLRLVLADPPSLRYGRAGSFVLPCLRDAVRQGNPLLRQAPTRCDESPPGFHHIGQWLQEMHEALRDFVHLRFHVNSSLRSDLREATGRRWMSFIKTGESK